MESENILTRLTEAIDRLIEANLVLWHKEDQRRDRSAGDKERLQAADDVIVWNRKRNQTLDEINGLLAELVSQTDKGQPAPPDTGVGAVMLTGSFADLIDRLSIAKIRHYHLKESSDPEVHPRLERVSNEIHDLKQQISQALALVLSLPPEQRSRLLGFGKNKIYKDEESYT